MEVLKKPKSNLVAIYHLEFYKKQKNWKLSMNKKTKECDVGEEIKNQLNETCDVMEPKTKVCELNDGFYEIDSGNASTSNCQQSYSSKLAVPDYPAYNCQNALHAQQVNDQILDSYPQDHIHSKPKPQTPILPLRVDLNCDDWSGENLDCYCVKQENLDFNVCSEKVEPQCWLDKNKNGNHVPESDQVSPTDWSPAINALNCGDNATNAFCKAEDMPPRNEYSWLLDEEDPRRIQEIAYSNAEDEWDAKSIVSVDSWEEFVGGANVVPHSSEIELNLSNVLSDVELNENSLAHLSSAQFSAKIQTHARALRHLLHEKSQRQRIYSYISLTDRTRDPLEITPRAGTAFNSYDEYLARDINPSVLYTASNCKTLRHEKTSTTEDLFAAGSYKNVDLEVDLGVGKGRGRLHVAPVIDSRKGVIGIGRGRPFRL